ncbi:MAG: hypothetical protein IPL52_03200 [Flavobacteriales bacterium]|nr:hypothetical protein [Flavobacteriales bacterium]
MSIILSDAGLHDHPPLTFTRPAAQLRARILRISEGSTRSGLSVGYRTEDYLAQVFPMPVDDASRFEVDGGTVADR